MNFDRFKKYSIYTWLEYLHMWQKLLPQGKLWGFDIIDPGDIIQDSVSAPNTIQDSVTATDTIQDTVLPSTAASSSTLGQLFAAIAKESARIESRTYDALNETTPGLSYEMLEEWRNIYIRDEFENELITTDDELRAVCHGKEYDEYQVATASFFENYAETLGFEIAVNENPAEGSPARCGSLQTRCSSSVTGKRCSKSDGFNSIVEMDILVDNGGNFSVMEYLFNKTKPSHILIVWDTADGHFDYPNDTGTLNIQAAGSDDLTIKWGDNTQNAYSLGSLTTYSHVYNGDGTSRPVVLDAETPVNVTQIRITSDTDATGDIGEIAASFTGLTHLYLNGCNFGFTDQVVPAWSSADIRLQDNSLTSTEVDNFLIQLDTAGGTGGTLNIAGTNAARTNNSDSAYTSLVGKSWTITVNT